MNIDKLIQTVGYVLSKSGGKLNYTKLIKLLYLADRESIAQTDVSITSDTYVSMPQGPVLEGLYELIRGISTITWQVKWNASFEKDGFYLIALRTIPTGELSRYEMWVLDSVVDKYKNASFGDMISVVHNKRVCPEWENPHGSSHPLPKRAILTALGRTDKEIAIVEEEDELDAYDNEMLALLERA